jgi:hypothetical protein
MPERDEMCTFDALLIGEQGDCLHIVAGEIVLLVEKASILDIEEIDRDNKAGAAAPVRLRIVCAGSIRRIEPAGPLSVRPASDPFAVRSRALWDPPELLASRGSSPAYRTMVERFLEARGLRPKPSR